MFAQSRAADAQLIRRCLRASPSNGRPVPLIPYAKTFAARKSVRGKNANRPGSRFSILLAVQWVRWNCSIGKDLALQESTVVVPLAVEGR